MNSDSDFYAQGCMVIARDGAGSGHRICVASSPRNAQALAAILNSYFNAPPPCEVQPPSQARPEVLVVTR